jgi:hypothetical protein
MNEHEKELKDIEQNDEMKEINEASCGCCCGSDESEDISLKELAHHADDKIDALIQLLIKKKLFTENEFEEEYASLFEEDGKED